MQKPIPPTAITTHDLDSSSSSSSITLNQKCCICHDMVIIPTRPICFKCSSRDRWSSKTCYTYLRICMNCADEYFQLTKKASDRKRDIKCLICQETMDATKNNRNTTYEIDFLFMRCLPTRLVECPFCHIWSGDLNSELYRHVITDCTRFTWECSCGQTYNKNTRLNHVRLCSKYSTCRDCDQRILSTLLSRHMLQDHKCSLCCSCRIYVPLETMSDHILNKCDERLVCCDICMGLIRMRYFNVHLQNHYTEVCKRIRTLSMNLDNERERLSHLLDICSQSNIRLPYDSSHPNLPAPQRSIISQEDSSDHEEESTETTTSRLNTNRPNTPEPFTVIFDSVTRSESTESTEEESTTPSSTSPVDADADVGVRGEYNLTTITSWERLQEWLRSQSDTLLFSDSSVAGPLPVGGDSKDAEDDVEEEEIA